VCDFTVHAARQLLVPIDHSRQLLAKRICHLLHEKLGYDYVFPKLHHSVEKVPPYHPGTDAATAVVVTATAGAPSHLHLPSSTNPSISSEDHRLPPVLTRGAKETPRKKKHHVDDMNNT
jgi:hypothetical protein